MTLESRLLHYQPWNEQENRDRDAMLRCVRTMPDVLLRQNLTAHLTASAWLVNQDRSKVLMAYHNLYNSWAWLGGHADGDGDLLAVALREAHEESGLQTVTPVSGDIFSLEVLTVDGHIKRRQYVPSHLHLNVTYLLQADENEALRVKPDENSGVRWFALDEAVAVCTEPWMQKYIYQKLNEKLRQL